RLDELGDELMKRCLAELAVALVERRGDLPRELWRINLPALAGRTGPAVHAGRSGRAARDLCDGRSYQTICLSAADVTAERPAPRGSRRPWSAGCGPQQYP